MNDPRKLFVDERLTGMCVFCGGRPNTRDHCPSKVLLDEPFPLNLPVVNACERCNQSFSKDEQYLACFIECAISGSTDPSSLRRTNIARILQSTPQLASQIQASMVDDPIGGQTWRADMDRVRSIVVKLARDHLDFELSIQEMDEPDEVVIVPLARMCEAQRTFFECPEPGPAAIWPELGSRAFMRMFPSGDKVADGWLDIQEGCYRYLVGQTQGNFVLAKTYLVAQMWSCPSIGRPSWCTAASGMGTDASWRLDQSRTWGSGLQKSRRTARGTHAICIAGSWLGGP